MSRNGETFGERVHKHRRRRGMSMDELADAIGKSKSTVHRIERDESMPRLNVANRLADALGVEIGDLVDWSHNPT